MRNFLILVAVLSANLVLKPTIVLADDFCADSGPMPVIEDLKKNQSDNKDDDSDQTSNNNLWTCSKFKWAPGPGFKGDVSQLFPPGETQPAGNTFRKCDYPHSMIVAGMDSTCSAKIPATTVFKIDEKDLLDVFFDVVQVISTEPGAQLPDSNLVKNRMGTIYEVRKKEVDRKNHAMDMYSHVGISYDLEKDDLYATLILDKVVSDPNNEARYLKKLAEFIHVYKIQKEGGTLLVVDTSQGLWAANPSAAGGAFKGLSAFFAKGPIKKENTSWKNDLMKYLLSSALNPPLMAK